MLKGAAIEATQSAPGEWSYAAAVPEGSLRGQRIQVQIEGCRRADIHQAQGDDWVKAFRELRLIRPERRPGEVRAAVSGGAEVRLYFGIHKHMHQPYYNTADRHAWDGEKDGSSARARATTRTSSRRRAPVHRRRAAARRAVHELERLADRAARPLRRRGALRRTLRRLESTALRQPWPRMLGPTWAIRGSPYRPSASSTR
jgi:hypothetical protein